MQLTKPGEILLAQENAITESVKLANEILGVTNLLYGTVNDQDWTCTFDFYGDYTTFPEATDSQIKQLLAQIGGDGFNIRFYPSKDSIQYAAIWSYGRQYVFGTPDITYVIHKHLVAYTYAADGTFSYEVIKNSDTGAVGVKK